MNHTGDKKRAHNSRGRPKRWTYISPPLESLARRLSLGGGGFEPFNDSCPQKAGQVRGADHVLALHGCAEQHPMMWDLFWSKYMEDTRARDRLLAWVRRELQRNGVGVYRHCCGLAPLVLDQFIDGHRVTGRSVADALGVARQTTWTRLRPSVNQTLDVLYRAEDTLAAAYRRRAK